MTTDGQRRPILAEAATAALAQADIPSNRAAVKGAGLQPEETELYWAVMQAFPEVGGPPPLAWVTDRATALGLDVETVLAEFAARDLIQRDPETGAITAAYPFSGVPTPHQVTVAGGRPVSSMCAVDALGIPFMFGRDAVVRSLDPTDGTPIRVDVRDGVARWHPADAVVVVGSVGDAGASAATRCPFINFFASRQTAEAYLQSHPTVTGTVLDRDAALEAGKRVFGTDGILTAYVERGEACCDPCGQHEAAG